MPKSFEGHDDYLCDFKEEKGEIGGKGKVASGNIGELQKSDGSWDKTSIASLKQHYRLTDKAFDELTAVLSGNLELCWHCIGWKVRKTRPKMF